MTNVIRRLRDRLTVPPKPKLSAGPAIDGQPPTFNGDKANLWEDVGDGSTEAAKVGFSPEGGKSQRLWQITPANVGDLISSFPVIIGSCAYEASGTGKLQRTLPMADPMYAWMYASSIPGVEGYGRYNHVDADATLEAPGFPFGAFWDNYRLGVESLPRPFPVLPDSSITSRSGRWYPEAGGGTTEETFTVAEEQFRYCTWDMQPQSDYITQQKGTMKFNSSDSANAHMFAAMPRFFLPNSLYTITWYYVPIRLIVSAKSYILRWRGRINQNRFIGPDGLEFDPGELLYLNFSQKMFTPPVQNMVDLGGESTIVSTEKFAHITLTFLFTRRKRFSDPGVTVTNQNYVTGGHNLMPWNDGNFRYAAVQGGDERPTWLSAPLETLFTDCDSPNGVPE